MEFIWLTIVKDKKIFDGYDSWVYIVSIVKKWCAIQSLKYMLDGEIEETRIKNIYLLDSYLVDEATHSLSMFLTPNLLWLASESATS